MNSKALEYEHANSDLNGHMKSREEYEEEKYPIDNNNHIRVDSSALV